MDQTRVASLFPTEQMPLGGRTASALLSIDSAPGSRLCSPSPVSQMQARKWWELRASNGMEFKELPPFWEIRLWATDLMAAKYQAGLITGFTGWALWENNQIHFYPVLKYTDFLNNLCDNVRGISITIPCHSLRPSMYICAWCIIFPCNPLLYFLAPMFEGRHCFGERKQL